MKQEIFVMPISSSWTNYKGTIMSILLGVSGACLAQEAIVKNEELATQTVSLPANFKADTDSLRDIKRLLDAYTNAVSTKDQAAFEALLLTKSIPFSYVSLNETVAQTNFANYESFRRGVFEGAPFTQRFKNVEIQQDGSLASVTLIFINSREQKDTWGWKTLHLLKTEQGWKIASEFFTIHS